MNIYNFKMKNFNNNKVVACQSTGKCFSEAISKVYVKLYGLKTSSEGGLWKIISAELIN
jgi:hypothetical protein